MESRELNRVALIGSYLPRPCGIATFTGDVYRSICQARPDWDVSVIALNDGGGHYEYPPEVKFEVDQTVESYRRTARFLNAGHFDAVFLQHEYGLFGGSAGEMLFEMLDNIRVPLVTMLHTVLKTPDDAQFRVLRRLASRSAKVITMSLTGQRFLTDVFDISDERIEMMPHGIPDASPTDGIELKSKLGLSGRKVALTFGLLSPGKGLENAIASMPAVVAEHPDAMYVVLGATHPHLVKQQGESYRESLESQVTELGLQDHVRFVNKFVELDELTDFIGAADIYLTPYLNEAQITSGTLAYAYGCGKPVVSTPYWHAVDLLSEGRGRLVPFGDIAAMSDSVNELFGDDELRLKLSRDAYAEGREMIWSVVGERMAECLEGAHNQMLAQVDVINDRLRGRTTVVRCLPSQLNSELTTLTEVNLTYLSGMTDPVGLIQHAIFDFPNWHEGYCVDDNARGLLLTLMLDRSIPEVARLHRIYKSFVHYAIDPATGHVRNFMGFDRKWLERRGSDDSIGRVAWALGSCVGQSDSSDDQEWAASIFEPVLREATATTSPRTWAFGILAADEFLKTMSGHRESRQTLKLLAQRFVDHFHSISGENWAWFEDLLTYDNAKLPHALLVAGQTLGNDEMIDIGIASLRWLCEVQTSPDGKFRPIGNRGFFRRGKPVPAYDQQPLEAWATVSATLKAAEITGDSKWERESDLALAWFMGRNELRTPVIDLESGACHDGVQFDRINRNRGAESTLAWLLAATEWRQRRTSGTIILTELSQFGRGLTSSPAPMVIRE